MLWMAMKVRKRKKMSCEGCFDVFEKHVQAGTVLPEPTTI
jgi:hypothetical protein